MSATDELRKMLDERGVEYKSHYLNTSWYVGMKLYMATDDVNGTLTVDNLTPEQAIAATLGNHEIVRCRDCIGLVETWNGWECERFSGEYHRAEPDGFCAWGERRDA